MKYAEVSVNSPIAQRQTFSYTVPDGLDVAIGHAVWVPFGNKILQGIVIELSPSPAVEETREIIGLIEPRPVLSPAHLSLARWISEHYLSSLFNAVALMLPPGFERKAVIFLSLTTDYDITDLTLEQGQVIESIRKRGRISLKEMEKISGKKRVQAIVSKLAGRGIIIRSYQIEPIKVRSRQDLYLELAITVDKVSLVVNRLLKKRATKQVSLLNFLSRQSGSVPWSEIRRETGSDKTTANALVRKGLAAFKQVGVRREPISYQNIRRSSSLKFSTDQKSAFEAISDAINESKARASVFLLHGVTGSGKTEIYLQALAEATKRGKRGIVLVPEIALTFQTIERFAARFPHKVAVLHSKLSLGEQFDEWQRMRNGECDVVIGSRSAIFAPQPDLGLIVIDEEHEWTYKQNDKSPRYNARAAALKLAELTGAVVILGSATPDVETYYRARKGYLHLLQLPQRIVPEEGVSLPRVQVVDMREELKAGNRSIFSHSLAQEMTRAMANGEQVILFLNRRGADTFIQCRDCGFVLRCRRCDVALTHHPNDNTLTCHQCNYKTLFKDVCPNCSSRRIKFLGMGTQKLEYQLLNDFPQARQLRWDSDTTRNKDSHQKILSRFRNHEADILIGTQMVAKGLDFPSVTLVGVVSADTSLNLPDFRAGERTFQILSQVAGRAGRGVGGGKVIIQTFSPEHYAVRAAAKHDYDAFYESEIAYRRQLHNTPFNRLALLVYSHTANYVCQKEAERVKKLLVWEIDSRGIGGISLIGPAPAFRQRLRGRFRWQLILRGSGLSAFLSEISFPIGWTVDIDPVSVI